MSDGSHSEPCINWPCAKGAGHAGPCGTSRDELSSEQLAEILSDAHAIHCAAEVGMPCDCQVPDAIAELLRRAEPPPSRIGPTEPDDPGIVLDDIRALIAKAGGRPDSDLDWQKAYELDANGQRTGRWQWMNERGERDEFYPGRWLDAGDTCQPPRAEGRSDE